jgi:hypothetical protein
MSSPSHSLPQPELPYGFWCSRDPTLVVIGPEPRRRKPNITAPVLAPPAASEPLPLDPAIQAAVEAVLLEKYGSTNVRLSSREHRRALTAALKMIPERHPPAPFPDYRREDVIFKPCGCLQPPRYLLAEYLIEISSPTGC